VFSQCPKYEDWKNQASSSTLTYVGKLGSGKSILLANIVEDLMTWVLEKTTPIAYFFCCYDILESLKARTIFRSLVRQLLSSIQDFELKEELPDKSVSDLDIETLQSLLRHIFPRN
jgi:DNA replication protein DnaC